MIAGLRRLTTLGAAASLAVLASGCQVGGDVRDSAMGTTQSKGVYDTSATRNVPDSTTGLPGRTGRPGVAGDTLAGRRPPPSP